MSSQLLTHEQELLINDLDNLIDHCEKIHKPLKHITLTQRQCNLMKKISEKAEKGDVYSRVGKIQIKGNKYRGLEFMTTQQLRKRHKRKDTADIFEGVNVA